MPSFGFCGPSYTAQSPILDDEMAMNCYCENAESEGAASQRALLHVPGKKVFCTLPEPKVPGLFTVNGRTFAAATNLYEILAGGGFINRGSLGAAPVNPTQITANQNQLVILNNGKLYVLTFKGAITAAGIGAGGTGYAIGDTGVIDGTGSTYTVTGVAAGGVITAFTFTPGSNNSVAGPIATAVLTGAGDGTFTVNVTTVADNNLYPVPTSQFQGLIAQIDFCDGYVIATLQNSHTFQVSNLEDATVWNGLNVSTLSYFPDNIVSLKVLDRYVWLQSGKKSLAYYDSGAGFPPFIPVQGEMFEHGAGAAFATVVLDDSLFWLDQDERGFMVARRLGQGRISTHAVELAWQQYATTSDAVGWTYQEFGHQFWVIYFPTANATWVYDTVTGFWHQRSYYQTENGSSIADRAMCHTLNFGIHLVGDWASGNIYQLSSAFFTDAGNPIRGVRRTPQIAKENKWLYFRQIEFVLETGVAPQPPLLDGAGNPRGPQLMLRWSNDGGKTWSNTYFLDCGQAGQYDVRVIKRMLGRARKRIWEVSWTDPVAWRFNDAFVEADLQVA